MNQHVKTCKSESTDLNRRSFLVGTTVTGLVLGYAGVPGIDQASAVPTNFEPIVWYSISPDGLVTVTYGKADMEHVHRFHHGPDYGRGARHELEGYAGAARLERSKVQRRCAERADHRRKLVTMMIFDAMIRADAAGRIALAEQLRLQWALGQRRWLCGIPSSATRSPRSRCRSPSKP